MKLYERPMILTNEGLAEGIYMASGDQEETQAKCRFGRSEANPGSDVCQNCSVSGGVRSEKLPGTESPRREDFTTCIENVPIKEG